jgi:cardiolipin synthase
MALKKKWNDPAPYLKTRAFGRRVCPSGRRYSMSGTKNIADLLTLSRVVIALLFVLIGYAQVPEGMSLGCMLLMLSWTSDLLDGGLARLSKQHKPTWIGDNDIHIDMAVAVGVLTYLALCGAVGYILAIVYGSAWIAIFVVFGLRSSLGKLFQAPIYGWFIWIALREAPLFGWSIVDWILIAVIITWPRFPQEVIPSFLKGWNQTNSRHPSQPNS